MAEDNLARATREAQKEAQTLGVDLTIFGIMDDFDLRVFALQFLKSNMGELVEWEALTPR